MVRIKHRYLLLHILYPDSSDRQSKSTSSTDKSLPDIVQFHSPSPDDLTPQLLALAIKDQVQYLYGDYGLGLVSSGLVGTISIPSTAISPNLQLTKPPVKYLSPATSTAIIRCSRNHFRLVWAALSFMTQLPHTRSQKHPRPCVMQVVRVSGTIKKAEEEAIRRAKDAILKGREDGQTETDGLIALLGKEDEQVPIHAKGGMSSGMDVDEDDEIAMDSDEDG